MKKSPLTIIIILLVVVVVLVGGTIAALYILFPPQKIVALIVPQAQKALGREVTLEKAGISLFPKLGVSLSGLSVANTSREGFSRDPFIRVSKFTVSISLGSLLRGSPEIASIVIHKPEIRIEIDKAGSFNFDDLALMTADTTTPKPKKEQGPPALPLPITLKKFVIDNGVIVYDDIKAGNRITIGNVQQNVAVSMDKALKDIKTTGDLVLGRVSVKTKDIKKPLSNLCLTVSHDMAANLADGGGIVMINKMRLSFQKIFLELRGSVNNAMTPEPQLDLTVASDPISISDVLKEVPVELVPLIAKVTGGGTAELDVAVKGVMAPDAPLPVKGALALKSVTIKYTDLPQAIHNLNADITFTDNSLTVKTMKMELGTNPIEITAIVNNFAKPIVDAAVAADIKLGEIKDVLELPDGASLDGRVVADIKATGEADPADPTKLNLKGLVDLKNVTVLWSPLIKPAVINGKLTLSSKAVGEKMSVAIGKSSLSTSATISNYLSFILPDTTRKLPRTKVDFTMNSPFLNVDDILMPPPPAKEGEKAGAGQSAPILVAPLPSADLRGTVTAKKIIYQGFTMNNMVAKISVVNNIADMNFKTGFAGGTISDNLNADLGNIQNITFRNSLNVQSIEVNDLMARFGDYIKPVTPLNRQLLQINKCLFGRINLKSSMAGSGATADDIMKTITGNIGIRMAQGKIVNAPAAKVASSSFASFLKTDKLGNFNEIAFRALNATIRLANGQAVFDDLTISSNVADWSVKGKVGFNALMDMAISSRLSKSLSGKLLAVEGALKGGVKGALGKTKLAQAAGMLDNMNVIPRDNQGRVTLTFGMGGPVADPKIKGLAFGASATGSAAAKQATPQQQVREQARQVVEEKKQEIQKQVEEKKEEVKKEVKKTEEQVKKKARDKLKGLLK